ncbi:hypothetical protein HZH68_016149 [Vespula germanica]|uniref:Uncharacterized protein n=1 Tax=Vespula germanica TaxID=30212 RepID=A0A834MRR9_VESGE|nr:hypothetical protein HZH68_016149 [Vespula germanica]
MEIAAYSETHIRFQALHVNKYHDTVIDLNIFRQNMKRGVIARIFVTDRTIFLIIDNLQNITTVQIQRYCYQYEYWWCAVSCYEVYNKFSSKSTSNFISQYVNKKRKVRGEIPKGYTQCHVPAVFGHHGKYRDRGYYYDGERYVIGTMRSNHRRIPKDLLAKKLKRHEYVAKENKNGLTVLKWKDK